MNSTDLQANLEILFGVSHSPGQAFDALVAMRHNGVTLEMVRLHLCDSITQTELAMSRPANEIIPEPSLGFTENSPMPFGKHRGTPLKSLPVAYLAWLADQGDQLTNKELAKFLKTYDRAKAGQVIKSYNQHGLDDPDDGDYNSHD